MESHCGIDVDWSPAGNAGAITTRSDSVPFTEFCPTKTAMGELTPEALLLAAMASCYGITFANLLRGAALPGRRDSVRADGVIANEHGTARFTRVIVRPLIRGADIARRHAYNQAAVAAREDCLIGRSIRGNVAFVVGDVSLMESTD
jgi:organic hydroperoxide reductase OsmC/OhrA